MAEMISGARLRELLKYDPETGAFEWRSSRQGARLGLSAGRVNTRGYSQIGIEYRRYAAHRLAWLYVNDEWPSVDIDHINGNRADNRIANLRLASQQQNTFNRRTPKTNRSGFKGVYKDSPNRWRAQIKVSGKQIVLGYFVDPALAHAAYMAAAAQHFGAFASDGSA